jgi:hypothetical protein
LTPASDSDSSSRWKWTIPAYGRPAGHQPLDAVVVQRGVDVDEAPELDGGWVIELVQGLQIEFAGTRATSDAR